MHKNQQSEWSCLHRLLSEVASHDEYRSHLSMNVYPGDDGTSKLVFTERCRLQWSEMNAQKGDEWENAGWMKRLKEENGYQKGRVEFTANDTPVILLENEHVLAQKDNTIPELLSRLVPFVEQMNVPSVRQVFRFIRTAI